MELNQQVKEQISKIPQLIRKRGLEIYNQGWVEAIFFDQATGDFEFEIKGNVESFYQVTLDFSTSLGQLNTSCDCVHFASAGVCKHLASALYYIQGHLGTAATQRATPKIQFRQPIQLDVTGGSVEDPDTLLRPLITPHSKVDYDYTVRLLPDELRVQLSSLWKFSGHQDVTVGAIWKDEAYWLACSDKSCKDNCDHIQWLIAYVLRFRKRNLLIDLRQEAFEQRNADYLTQQQIALHEGDDVNDLLETLVIGEDIRIFPKGRIQGLASLEGMSQYVQKEVLAGIATPAQKEKLVVKGKASKLNDLKIPAYVWVLNDTESTLEQVISVKGKPNKAKSKIASHLQPIASPGDLELEEGVNLESSFYSKEKINSILVEERNASTESELFAEMKQLIDLSPEVLHYFRKVTTVAFGQSWQDFKLADMDPLVRVEGGVKLIFKLFQEEDLFTLQAYLQTSSGVCYELGKDMVLYHNLLVFYQGGELFLINSMKESRALVGLFKTNVFRTNAKGLPEFMQQIVYPIAAQFPTEIEDGIPGVLYNDMKFEEKRLYLSELNQVVMLRPVMVYEGGREVNVMEDFEVLEQKGEDYVVYERDTEAEKKFVGEVAALHASFQPKTQQSFFFLSYKQLVKDHWFLHAFEELKRLGVKVYGLNELKNLKFSPHRAAVSISYKSNQDWFETDIDVAFGDNKVSLKDVKKAIERGSMYVELTDGTLGILPEEWLNKFSKILRTAQIDKGAVRISKSNFNAIDDLVNEVDHPEVFREIMEKKAKLETFSSITVAKKPDILQADLRDYQQAGLNWLNFLREFGWGGILADDMGLGKTLQALALICLELEKNPNRPNLVIAPTTLLFNWKDEIEKFAPGLDYFIHHGQRYDSADEFKQHQLVLTSYGVAVNDIALLNKIDFNLIIADESQAIKNLNSKRHKALVKLKGRVKVAMSGTPIENSVYELYAQMQFVNPGFFQGLSAFKEYYASAIERDSNVDLIAELRKKIKPFILRRTKEEVLTELPEKTEEYLYCEMSPAQRKVYDAFRNEYRNYLMEKFDSDGLEKSHMHVLEGLTRLRQVCDSPQLIEREGLTETSSAKLDELVQHVQEKTGKHKILVFSQFVKMLKLVERKFVQLGITYEYLDGQTTLKNREKKVKRFQEDSECRVFLISLKAGGTGLNLTSADYVYIMDPWWNPAVENQAIDRCYRMGQKKSVMAYRMICKGTVEEKIISLQDKKRALSKEIVGAGDGIMKKLTREDIEELFS